MRLRLAVILLLISIPTHAQLVQQIVSNSSPGVVATPLPTLVQMRATPSDIQSQSPLNSANSFIQTCFANTTKVNNTIIAKVRTSIGTIGNISFSDDGASGGNVYTLAADEIAGARTTAVYTAPVVHTSRCVTVTFSTGSPVDDEVEIYEYQNIAGSSPVDKTCVATVTSGTAPACASMTPSVSNDLILVFADVVTFTAKPTGSMTFTAQAGTTPTYTLRNADGTSWSASESAVDAATSAITPSITISQSTTRTNVVGIALKQASNGTTFSGIHVNKESVFAPMFANSTAISGATRSQTIQFPCTGNGLWMLVGQGASSGTSNTTTVTDTNSNTWTKLTNLFSSGDGFAVQWIHADAATCNGTENITLNFTALPTFMTIVLFDLSNATGYDSSATCGAGSTPCAINTTSAVNPPTTLAGSTITPSVQPGVILSYQNQDFDTISGVNVGAFSADVLSCPGQSPANTGCGGSATGTALAYTGSGWEQDAGILVDYYSSTSAIAITWTVANTQSQSTGPFFSSTVAVKQ